MRWLSGMKECGRSRETGFRLLWQRNGFSGAENQDIYVESSSILLYKYIDFWAARSPGLGI